MKNKSCELEIISTEPIKAMLPSCIETTAQIVNISLTKGSLVTDWKTAIVRSPAKKAWAQPNDEKLQTSVQSVFPV